MEAWKALVNTALLGTDKRNNSAELVAGLTGVDSAAGAPSADAETTFLRDTALLSAYRRGGTEALRLEVGLDPALPETRPYAGPAGASALAEILQAENPGLLRLWLTQAQRHAQLIPLRHLDDVLDATRRSFQLHPTVRETAGNRGIWLAALNPEWSFLNPAPVADLWDNGTSVERSAYLQWLRSEDPAKARGLLEAVWAKEGADARERLLGALETGLGPDDLSFVEAAAADKSKRVASQALELLTRIPGSSVVHAFEAWLRDAVRLQTKTELPGISGKTTLDVSSPELLDKRMLDAIGKKPTTAIGDAQFHLQQTSAMVPPEFWESHLDLPADMIVELLATAAPETFPDALAASASRFANRHWAAVLAQRATRFYPDLLPLLDEPQREAYLLRFAAASPEQVLQFYAENTEDWQPSATRALLAHIAAQPYQYNKQYIRAQAWRIPLSALPLLEGIEPQAGPGADYLRNYAAQVWPVHRQALRDALELKERILNSFTA